MSTPRQRQDACAGLLRGRLDRCPCRVALIARAPDPRELPDLVMDGA